MQMPHSGCVNFRDQLVAAPLKRRPQRRHGQLDPAHFRDQLVAAPLKLVLALAGAGIWLHFRDQLVAAPLKLGHADGFLYTIITISATNWSRPH